MGKLERAEQSLAADPIDLSALSKRIDLFFERLQTLDNGFKSRWLALKHAIGNHLSVVGSKRLQERCSRNQTQAARKAGVVLGVGGTKENTLMPYDIFEECPVSEGGFTDLVVSQDCEVMPMA